MTVDEIVEGEEAGGKGRLQRLGEKGGMGITKTPGQAPRCYSYSILPY